MLRPFARVFTILPELPIASDPFGDDDVTTYYADDSLEHSCAPLSPTVLRMRDSCNGSRHGSFLRSPTGEFRVPTAHIVA